MTLIQLLDAFGQVGVGKALVITLTSRWRGNTPPVAELSLRIRHDYPPELMGVAVLDEQGQIINITPDKNVKLESWSLLMKAYNAKVPA